MKSFFAAAIVAVTQASNVHDFFAESNYICELCQTAVKMDAQGADAALDKLYEIFPAF